MKSRGKGEGPVEDGMQRMREVSSVQQERVRRTEGDGEGKAVEVVLDGGGD